MSPDASLPDWRTPRALSLLLVFLAAVIGIGMLIGMTVRPGEWYAALEKPPFNPPNWLFGPVWLALYVLIAIAGWRTFLREPRGTAMHLWYAQMGFNWLWTPVWFGLNWMWPAFIVIVAILLLVVGFILQSWRDDRLASLLFVPYAAWVGFATLLNVSIAMLN